MVKQLPLSDLSAALTAKLVDSEWCLIEFMTQNNAWNPPPPTFGTPPSGYQTTGNLDFGIFLFLINNTNYITDPTLVDIIKFIGAYITFPTSQFPENQYSALSNNSLSTADGGIVGTNPYEMYDQNWLTAFTNFVKTQLFGYAYNNGTLPIPGSTYAPVTATTGSGSSTITVGLVSDWGTGGSTASTVIGTLAGLNPDYVVHLGDVYYSGAPTTSPGTGDEQLTDLGEENTNLVAAWKSSFDGKSFTLNSNHEMYCGALGLFEVALASDGPFSAQISNSTPYSMFCLRIADWTIFGLDSAFNSDPEELHMFGLLDPPEDFLGGPQASWVSGLMSKLNIQSDKVILLTHHNGFGYAAGSWGWGGSGSPLPPDYYQQFWRQVRGALGGDPYAWYWGHVHNAIVYTSPVKIMPWAYIPPATPLLTTNTYCRCLGHGALPFAEACYMTSPNIEWYLGSSTNGCGTGTELNNGFATLSFTIENSVCTSITENFCDGTDGSVVFTKEIFSSSASDRS